MNKSDRIKEKILKHKQLVDDNIEKFIKQLKERAKKHDDSKLEQPEFDNFLLYIPMLQKIKYGSKEYKETLEKMKPFLKHHYEKNRHHPEHFENGIDDMNLVDIVEMFCDWKAAIKKHKDGNIKYSICVNSDRFKMSDQLRKIFMNTIDVLENNK